jgi:hypothetical protein
VAAFEQYAAVLRASAWTADRDARTRVPAYPALSL